MPKPLQYRAGSLIYFQGDPADKVFILQKGKVNLVYQDIETGQDVHDLVQPGEFFGVKSSLGRYPREENAVAIQDALIMAFSLAEFEAMAMANTRIIMKMLKVFSNQLRRIHKQVSSLMDKEEQQNPEAGLFSVGEYYLKNKRFAQARNVFSRYLTYYPTGRNAGAAARNLEAAEKALPGSGGDENSEAFSVPPPDFSLSLSEDASSPAQNLTDTAKAYYDAVSFISQQKYQQAYLAFKKIVDANKDPEYVVKSVFEIGRCLYLLDKFNDCIKYYTMMITRYPKHPNLMESLFFMGQSYEKNNRKDQAVTFYKKILSMGGDEDAGQKAMQALKALEEA
jgi:TolA-binding protein